MNNKTDSLKSDLHNNNILKNLKLSIIIAIIIMIIFLLSPDKIICRFIPYNNFITRPIIKPIIKFFLIIVIIFIILELGS